MSRPGRRARRLLVLALTLIGVATAAPAQSIDFSVMERIFQEPVTTAATGKPQRVSDVPANVEIITQAQIRRSGADNVPDVLRAVAGLDVRRYGAVDADVAVRGYNQPASPRLLVLVDGRQVYQDIYGYTAWQMLPVQLDEIRQIEVVKGPNSALYGFNAVGGVVNIVTYDPLYEPTNVATLRGGTQGLAAGSMVATGQLGQDAALRASVGGVAMQDYAPRGLPRIDTFDRHPARIGTLNLTARARLPGDIELTSDINTGAARSNELTPFGLFGADTYRTNAVRLALSADTAFGLLGANLYRNETLLGPVVATGGTNFRNIVYVAQLSDLVKLGADHAVRLAGEYRNNAARSDGTFQGTIGHQVLSGSVMWDWRITPLLSLTNAVRVDHMMLHYAGTLIPGTGITVADYNAATLTTTSFNTGLVWQISDADTVRLTAAKGVQLPSLVTYAIQVPPQLPFGIAYIGTPRLVPTETWNVEFGYDRALPDIGSVLRTAVYLQRNDDLLTTPFSAPLTVSALGRPLLQSANIGRSNAAGLELALHGKSTHGLHWSASYALETISDHTGVAGRPLPPGFLDFTHGTPRHVVILGGGYARNRLELDAQLRWQSQFTDYQVDPTATFLRAIPVRNVITVNARAGYRLTDTLTLALTAQQLNAPALLQNGGAYVERRLIASVTLRY